MDLKGIKVEDVCIGYSLEKSFIHELGNRSLITIYEVEDQDYLPENDLPLIEKFKQFYYDLEINFEGIETLQHLLTQVRQMQDQIVQLKNKLSFFER